MKPPKFLKKQNPKLVLLPTHCLCAFLPFGFLLTLAVTEKIDKLAAPLRLGPGSSAVDYYSGFPLPGLGSRGPDESEI